MALETNTFGVNTNFWEWFNEKNEIWIEGKLYSTI